uniref:LRRNT domain-containing protein n=1 Tax=Heterorhabditis bacteriophora TaxID=37862 RepID=A0A1I7XQI7_HETBA
MEQGVYEYYSMLPVLLLFAVGTSACQIGCECPLRTVAVCQKVGMRSVPILLNPMTTRLDLAHNRISKLSGDELNSIYPSEFY